MVNFYVQKNVITSYSIHYTKLYEKTPLPTAQLADQQAQSATNNGADSSEKDESKKRRKRRRRKRN